ncbi:glycoside hydrolase family 5 protein [Chaetomium sp. MPI-SDFR-AT-0129]|nr:glycoside hydrolase family 5 protein [Chaetomium sp. MPI-SDFR-AT-0129]
MALLRPWLALLGNLTLLLLTATAPSPATAAAAAAPLPALPLHSSSRWILDANNNRVKLRCVNWAGHMETNIPEGLQHQPLDHILDWIAAQGFNCVRLTYSIDHALNPDQPVAASFEAAATAAGIQPADMSALYARVVEKNPWIAGNSSSSSSAGGNGTTTTTRDVFAAVIDGLYTRNIMTLLDNHVSRASWCCDLTDGNGWWDTAFGYNEFNSRFFHTQDWLDGLRAMATWARVDNHPGVVAMSLRNELREFLLQDLNGRADWYTYVQQAGGVVHAAHPDVLVVVGGVQSSTDLLHVRTATGGKMLDTSGWAGKHVWEMHAYSFTVTFLDVFQSCDVVKAQYGAMDGFVLTQGEEYTGPLILSEFGVGMEGGDAARDGLSEKDDRYLSCIVSYMESNDAEWAVWAVQGSYYVRDGKTDYDESWGLLKSDWSDWRNPAFAGRLGAMWNMTQQP